MGDFKDKVAIVTGSSEGIGRAIAVEFAERGARLCLTARNETFLQETKQQCISQGQTADNLLIIVGDITKEYVAERIVEQTIATFGKLDILVNNAGTAFACAIVGHPMAKYDLIMNLNNRSVFFLTQLAIPHLERTKGNVINISSVAGIHAEVPLTAYCMSKAALNMLTKCLSIELGPKGVRVNSVCPGCVKTQIFRKGGVAETEEDLEQYLKEAADCTPLGRVCEMRELIKAVAFLASDDASFITGSNMVVDGGIQHTIY